MDALLAILEKSQVRLLLATVAIVIALALIFRRQIGELIARTASIEIDPKKRRWKIEFGQRVRQEEKKALAISRKIPLGPSVPVPSPSQDGATQTGREMVLEAWGAVRQAVYDGCIANRITITPTLGVPEAARRLREARGLSADLIGLVEFVDEFGREVAGGGGRRPEEDDAQAYRKLAYSVASWLGSSVLVPVDKPGPAPERRRPTVVGGNFIPPSPGNPSAALVAVAGPMKGQQYPIDKSNYRLGRSANNDLRATADDSVSGNHAGLRYENGGLFLYDEGSLNGTFLNEQRVTGSPAMVHHGDRIRLGESVFEVVGASASSVKDPIKGPPGRSVVG